MEYREGYSINSLETLLAYDTLQVMNEILQELKGIKELLEKPQEPITEIKTEAVIIDVPAKVEPEKVKTEPKKPVTRKPTRKKTVKKKTSKA